MRPWIHIGAVVFCVVLARNGDKPKELLETAELEERQHNGAGASRRSQPAPLSHLVLGNHGMNEFVARW